MYGISGGGGFIFLIFFFGKFSFMEFIKLFICIVKLFLKW